MITSKDEIENFIPTEKPRFIILGTMGSICARTIGDNKPKEAFFYHNNKNHFWKVLQLLFDPNVNPKSLTVAEKKDFLSSKSIAMGNLVNEMKVTGRDAADPSDEVLFKAYKDKKLDFKKLSSDFKKAVETTPIFFTCRSKNGIRDLIDGYLISNNISTAIRDRITFLPTPTRCNPLVRSRIWKAEIESRVGSLSY